MSKNFLTLIFSVLALHLLAQSPQIAVNVKDECGTLFSKQILIGLYKKVGKDTILISTQVQNPAVFKNLDKSSSYLIKVSSNDNPVAEPSVLDLAYLKNTILGITKLNERAIFAADVNNSSSFSTLDLVMIARHILNIQSHVKSGWSFAKSGENYPPYVVPSANIFNIDVLTNDISLDLISVKKGHIADATGLYCPGKCVKNKEGLVNIYFENLELQKGKTVEIPFYIKIDEKIAGLKLQIASASGSFSNPDGNTLMLISPDSTKVDVLWQENSGMLPMSNGFIKVFSLKYTPKESGLFINQVELNHEFFEGVVYEGACLVKLKSSKLNEFIPTKFCIISWPKDITIPECSSNYLTGKPEIVPECSGNLIVSYVDSIADACKKIYRKWTVLNFNTLQSLTQTQLITINPSFVNYCKKNVYFNLSTGSRSITPASLIENRNYNHRYSFSASNPGDTLRVLTYDASQSEEFYVHNLTTSEFCIASAIKTLCDSSTVNIRLKDIVSVTNASGYLVNAKDFDLGSQHGCGIVKEFEISFNNGPFKTFLSFDQSYKGQIILLKIRYKSGTTYFNYGTVKAFFLEDNASAPLEMSIYDDYLKKGNEYTLAVYSPNFKSVYSFQMGLKIKDAIFKSCGEGAIKIEYNEVSKGNLKMLFVDNSVKGINAAPDEPIFYIKLIAEKDGYVSEFLALSEEVLSSEATFIHIINSSKVKLGMFFPLRTLSSLDKTEVNKIMKIYPNPVNSDILTVELSNIDLKEIQVALFDLSGKWCAGSSVYLENQSFRWLVPDHLRNGLYLLKIIDGKKQYTSRISIIR
jgi:hypothetical protein